MYGLLGEELESPTPAQPVGGDHHQWMRTTAMQVEGIPFGFTTYRPADLTGMYPEWREFVDNVGDVDMPPIGVPMGPRHFSINARPPFPGA
ncbi:MAG: hypothetical protein ACXVXP_00500 [Mycobacteriaceae bacterium]